MNHVLLLFFAIAIAISVSAQDGEITFHVRHAKVADTLPDGGVDIHWTTVAPIHDSLDQHTVRDNFGAMSIYPVYYSYRDISDSTRLHYESIDINISNQKISTDYHVAGNRISYVMTQALCTTKPGDTVRIRLNRPINGRVRSELLTYRVVTFARFLKMKKANMKRIQKGLPVNL